MSMNDLVRVQLNVPIIEGHTLSVDFIVDQRRKGWLYFLGKHLTTPAYIYIKLVWAGASKHRDANINVHLHLV